MWRSAAKDNLRPQRKGYFGAQSHTPRNRCVRFVFGIAAASRNTRFQAACWALPGPDLHRPIAPASLAPSLCPPSTVATNDWYRLNRLATWACVKPAFFLFSTIRARSASCRDDPSVCDIVCLEIEARPIIRFPDYLKIRYARPVVSKGRGNAYEHHQAYLPNHFSSRSQHLL